MQYLICALHEYPSIRYNHTFRLVRMDFSLLQCEDQMRNCGIGIEDFVELSYIFDITLHQCDSQHF